MDGMDAPYPYDILTAVHVRVEKSRLINSEQKMLKYNELNVSSSLKYH